MSISITVQGTDKASLVAALLVALAALGGTAPTTATAGTAGTTASGGDAKAKAEADKKAKAEADKKAKAEADAKAKAEADAKKKAGGEITLESLRELGKAAIKAGKNAEMRSLLSKLGSESITALDTEKYAEFKSGIEAIIAGEEPAASEDDSAL